jgi:organic radical activating enzyme
MNQSCNIFCPLPWIGYSIRNDGNVRVCCHANQGKNNGLLFNNDGIPYTYKDGIESSRNSKTLKEIRKCILKNEWHPECIRCKNETKAKIFSRNSFESEKWLEYVNKDDALKFTNKDGSIKSSDFPLRHFDLRFGNLCNLKCRMCGSSDSNAWYKEQYETLGYKIFNHDNLELIKDGDKYYVLDDPYAWYDNDYFWEDLKTHIKSMKFCYMVGGEPLLIKKHYKFLEKCIEAGVSKGIEIEYNTNGTYLPEYTKELWKEFRFVYFGVSIDGVGKINEYIRYPSKWNTIENNLRKLDSYASNIKMWISATVMVYNILHIPEFFQWKLEQNYIKMKPTKNRPIISTHLLHTPSFLNIKIFPKESKNYIKELFTSLIINFQKETDYPKIVKMNYQKLLEGYINFMFQEDYSSKIPEFIEYNNKLDNSRKQNLDDFIPGLRGLL